MLHAPSSAISTALDRIRAAWGQEACQIPNVVPATEVASWVPLNDLAARLSDAAFLETHTAILRNKEISRNRRILKRDDLVAGLEEGMSLQLRQLERILDNGAPIVHLARTLERGLGHPLDSATLFITPAREQALPRHHDPYEVIVLQIAGQKLWKLPTRDALLAPGDMFYVPAGVPHQVLSHGDDATISVSFLYVPLKLGDVLAAWLQEFDGSNTFEASLPAMQNGVCPRQAADEMRDTLRRIVGSDDLPGALSRTFERLSLRLRPSPPPELMPNGPLTPDSRLERNLDVDFTLHEIGDTLQLTVSGGASLDTPFYVRSEVEAVLATTKKFRPPEVAINMSVRDVLKLLSRMRAIGILRSADSAQRE